ncbi:MAG: 30S ribosomal protein S3 [Nanoarchaeota archaeon]
MIEREFINQKTKEYFIKQYIQKKLMNVGVSSIRLKKIPMGEKIIIFTSRPSLIVGSKGANIRDLTKALKREFKLENPQLEINEVKDIFLDANIVAERIASSLERFGSARFKGIGHKILENVMNSGALGVEVIISGKIPGARAKSWRFYQGYLKKSGDLAVEGVRKAQAAALLKSGIIGIKVAIMPPDVELPDRITLREAPVQSVKEVAQEQDVKEEDKKSEKKKRAPSARKSSSPKKAKQKEIKESTEPEESASADVVEATVVEEIPTVAEEIPQLREEDIEVPEKKETSAESADEETTS